MRKISIVVFATLMLLTSRVEAALITGSSFSSDNTNPVYWSALGLDIMRLSWADTLGQPGQQAGLEQINQYIAESAAGWRWATLDEFVLLHKFFDTDSYADGWSQAQNVGSSLFFSLNGMGPAFSTQSGYDFEGYTYWQFGSWINTAMQYVWMADFATELPGIACADYSLLCGSGYFTDANTPLWQADNILQMNDINVAPLLVRTQINAVASVPGPASLSLLIAALLGLAVRFRKSKVR